MKNTTMTSHFHPFSPTCSSIVNSVHTIIDQTSFRTKGTVVVFGVTKLYIKDYISPASFPPHWLDKGGGLGVGEGWGKHLTISSRQNAIHLWSGQKKMDDVSF
jgi:hypothetical protein